jgi:hypothetical protein
MSNNGGMRVNIDPKIWHTIRNQVAVVWVQSLLAPAPEPVPSPSSHQTQADYVETNATLNIYVKTRRDKPIRLRVHQRDSIRRVKRLLENRGAFKATQNPLYLGGTLLEDDRSVGYYSITNGATLSVLCTQGLSEDRSHK